MELMLIRHGLPVRRELSDGIADPELADDGHAQARHLTEYLANESIDAIYTSPLRRAVQTAEPLAASKGLAINVIDSVAEFVGKDIATVRAVAAELDADLGPLDPLISYGCAPGPSAG